MFPSALGSQGGASAAPETRGRIWQGVDFIIALLLGQRQPIIPLLHDRHLLLLGLHRHGDRRWLVEGHHRLPGDLGVDARGKLGWGPAHKGVLVRHKLLIAGHRRQLLDSVVGGQLARNSPFDGRHGRAFCRTAGTSPAVRYRSFCTTL